MDKKVNIIFALIGSFILLYLPILSIIPISIFGSWIHIFLKYTIRITSFIGFLLVVYFAVLLIKSFFQDK